WPWYLAVLAAMLTGALIGLVLGTLVAKVGIPSFVVTLAAFLAFQGVLLLLVKEGTNISIRDETILAIANSNLPPLLGWIGAAVGVGAYAVVQIVQARRRAARGLVADPMGVIYFRIAVLAVIVGAAVYVLNLERSRNALLVSLKGVPIVVPLIVLLLVFWTFVLRRTAYGRPLYAVGGTGLLRAVGPAVTAGTRRFGGKGRVPAAVLGGAVVAVIDNGRGLMGSSAGVKFIVTGSVLLLAASVDALSRKRAAATGRRR